MASGVRVPHQQVEHTAAPTKHRRPSKKTLANGEPSTHGDIAPLLRALKSLTVIESVGQSQNST